MSMVNYMELTVPEARMTMNANVKQYGADNKYFMTFSMVRNESEKDRTTGEWVKKSMYLNLTYWNHADIAKRVANLAAGKQDELICLNKGDIVRNIKIEMEGVPSMTDNGVPQWKGKLVNLTSVKYDKFGNGNGNGNGTSVATVTPEAVSTPAENKEVAVTKMIDMDGVG